MSGSELGSAIGLQAGKPKDYTALNVQRMAMAQQQKAAKEKAAADAEAKKKKEEEELLEKWRKDLNIDPNQYHKLFQNDALKIGVQTLDKLRENSKSGNSNLNNQLILETVFNLKTLRDKSAPAFAIEEDFRAGKFKDKAAFEAINSGDWNKVYATKGKTFGQFHGADKDKNISVSTWKDPNYKEYYLEQNKAKEASFGEIGTLIPGQIKNVQVIKSATLDNVKKVAESQWIKDEDLRRDILATNEDFIKDQLAAQGYIDVTDEELLDLTSPAGKMAYELGKKAWLEDAAMHIEKDIDQQLLHLDKPASSSGNGSGGGKLSTIGEVERNQKINLGIQGNEEGATTEVRDVTTSAQFTMEKFAAPVASSPTVMDLETDKKVTDPGVDKATYAQFAVVPVIKSTGRMIPDEFVNGKNKVGKDKIEYKVVAIGRYEEGTGDKKVTKSIYRDAKEVTGSAQTNMSQADLAQFKSNMKELQDEANKLNGGKAEAPAKNNPAFKPSAKELKKASLTDARKKNPGKSDAELKEAYKTYGYELE